MANSFPPHPREKQIFPRLDAAMIARILPFGTVETPEAGALLFARGDTAADFFVVLDGEVQLLDDEDPEAPSALRSYGPGEFTGELHLFSERSLLVSGRAGAATRVLRVRRQDFRQMAATQADLNELLMRAFILRRIELLALGLGGCALIGPAAEARVHLIRTFLTRNAHPFKLFDPEEASGREFVQALHLTEADLPALVLTNGEVLRNPETTQIADALGLSGEGLGDQVFDLVVVGAGPSGLSAAVYGASEGLRTLVVERDAPGGQAGTSSRIENYMGFPTGISGQALANRALIQAQKFGAQFAISRGTVDFDCSGLPYGLQLDGAAKVRAKAVVIATGARYRRLSLPDYSRFEGAGIFYAATSAEAQLCKEATVVIVGGGNSAGQAAVFLSQSCRHVHMLVRAEGLAASMSDYLVQRIMNSAHITLHSRSEIIDLRGEAHLEHVVWKSLVTGEVTEMPAQGLFVMIGADPNTEWLKGCVPLDDKGFIRTGEGQAASPFATQLPGVFAVGDVRSGSVKRVASGVGEGSVVIAAVHRYLADLQEEALRAASGAPLPRRAGC